VSLHGLQNCVEHSVASYRRRKFTQSWYDNSRWRNESNGHFAHAHQHQRKDTGNIEQRSRLPDSVRWLHRMHCRGTRLEMFDAVHSE
jgi:hypothetical protein